MRRFAESTSVPVERSRVEIERLLVRYGADQFVSGWNSKDVTIGFRASNRFVRFRVVLPDLADGVFAVTKAGRSRRSEPIRRRLWEQACRQRWRALLLVIKAKLEAVAAGVSTFEDEFLAHTVIPGGQTVGEWAKPQVEAAYAGGKMPRMLPGLGESAAGEGRG